MSLALILAAASLTSANTPTTPQIYSAIWSNLFLNAMIGNGNHLPTGSWYWGNDLDHPPTLQISNVRCSALFGQRNCSFILTRTPDPESREAQADAAEHQRLRCSATLYRQRQDGGERLWRVLHFPPDERSGGHSRTSMNCRVARSR